MIIMKRLWIALSVCCVTACSVGVSTVDINPSQNLNLSTNKATCDGSVLSNESVTLTISGLSNGYDYQTGVGLNSNPADDSYIIEFENGSGTATGNTATVTIPCNEIAISKLELDGSPTGTAYLQSWSFATWGYSNTVAINLTGRVNN
ncbi:MAG: hypothetical protein PHC75_05075 [Burkholderiales bacterium]|nr:hypothetical protein [Burkholderiales bacterium]